MLEQLHVPLFGRILDSCLISQQISNKNMKKKLFIYTGSTLSQCTAGSLTSFIREEGSYIRLLTVSLHTKSKRDLLDTIFIEIQLPVESLMQLHAINC